EAPQDEVGDNSRSLIMRRRPSAASRERAADSAIIGLSLWRRQMAGLNAFIARTIAWYLVIAGAITATSVVFAVDIGLFTPIFGGVVDYTPASVPALRHWGFMIFGIGVLMIAAAFRPWLRFETMLFCTLEKCFIVF